MLYILYMVVALASAVAGIIVLVKLFQNEGALKGILGIICGLYTFIWGWMNAGRLNLRNIMIIWTIVIILQIILNVLYGGAMAGQYATPVAP